MSFDGYTPTDVPVVLKHLATTQNALSAAEYSQFAYPLPGLDDIQMDTFIDMANSKHNLRGLQKKEASRTEDYRVLLSPTYCCTASNHCYCPSLRRLPRYTL
jgi:hypothetical protein